PGLGANCTEQEFTEKFKKTNPETILADKDGGDIVSITGATITTRTVANSIREKFQELKEKFNKKTVDEGSKIK
ncbi:MAG: FMN-binding protein, partial [Candidatus Cloacimonetes bacterium]|nr:FMN-binding protein [Candidatus Cloacimonadota bacterium]